MHDVLQAQYDQLRNTHRVNRAAELEITAEITEAWQESDRDYVTGDMTLAVSGAVVRKHDPRARG